MAAPATAHPATQHGRKDDLNAVQVGGEVGPWETNTHLDEREQQQREARDELHPASARCDTLTPCLGKGRFISVRGRVCQRLASGTLQLKERCATGQRGGRDYY